LSFIIIIIIINICEDLRFSSLQNYTLGHNLLK